MARPLRIMYPGACYHVTARGNERRPIYRDDNDRQRFLRRLGEVVVRYRLILHAFVLMRNHYHLLIETPEANLSRALRQLNGVYTQDFNRRHRRIGHLFQGRYKALVVDKDAYLLELSRYIHLNPVRVGEVTDPAAFRWSSAGAYTGKRAAQEYLEVRHVLRHFGRSRSQAQRAYRRFLEEATGSAAPRPWEAVVAQTLLGGPRWIARMRRRVARRGVLREVPPTRQLRERPPVSVVVTQVCRAAGATRQEVVGRAGNRRGWARPVAMALSCEFSGLTQEEIGREFGVTGYAVSQAIRRARQLRAENRKVDKIVRALIVALKT